MYVTPKTILHPPNNVIAVPTSYLYFLIRFFFSVLYQTQTEEQIGGGLRFEASQIGYLPPMASSGVVLLSLALVTLSLPDQPLILCVQLAIITAFTDTSALKASSD